MGSAPRGVSGRLARVLPQKRSALKTWAMSSEQSWNPSPLALRTKVAGDDQTPCPSPLTLTCPSNPTNRGLVCRLHISLLAKVKGAEREAGAGVGVTHHLSFFTSCG
eukprot:6200921-Pleurochrysis_carterae.AAC.1